MSCTGSMHNLPSAWSVVSLQNGQISWWQNARGRSAGDSVSRHKWSTHWWPFEQSALEEICQVMNQPGAPQSDWLELMLEIWPCGRKQQSIACWSCLLLCSSARWHFSVLDTVLPLIPQHLMFALIEDRSHTSHISSQNGTHCWADHSQLTTLYPSRTDTLM